VEVYKCLFVTSAEEGGDVFGAVCLSVCPSDYSQTCERILMKFFGGWGMAQGPSDTILVAIRITLRIRKSKVRNLDPPDWRRFVLCECILVIIIIVNVKCKGCMHHSCSE